nr:family 78 glycoside hydrolase catalytic domain [Streptomyces chromofuscus]
MARKGTDIFAAYTAHGATDGESWHPQLNYVGMQWVQVTGLPDGCTPTKRTITGLHLHADVPVAGSYQTPYGEAAAEWTLKDGTFRLTVHVPPNTTVEVRIPKGPRASTDAPRGADLRGTEGDRTVYSVGSGTYSFAVRGVRPA